MKPLVSILIPAYNAQKWIADTLRSAVAQTWGRKEIIVVDDGSRDDTFSVAQRFESRWLKVVRQQNQGASAARNTALSLSQGDYIQWLDADDLLAPDKIARQMELATADPSMSRHTLISGSWGYFWYRDDRAKFISNALWCDLSPVEWLVRKMEQGGPLVREYVFIQTACWLVSRELTEAAGPWDTRLLGDDDGEYFCRVLRATDYVRFVPEAKVYYRRSPNSLSYIGYSDRKREAQWLSMQFHICCLRSLEESERVRTACVRYLQHWMVVFYPERLDIIKQAEEMARSLGGRLTPPRLSWKYSWIRVIFGWRLAQRARLSLPKLREAPVRLWDKVLFSLSAKRRLAQPGCR
jgi:glycosyltransferase involved in cell wall biosynthesis